MNGGVQNGVRAARIRLGLSQQELAARVGVTRQTIGAIEAGQLTPSTGLALRLARVLGCRVEDLFWLEEEAPVVEAEVAAEVAGSALTVDAPARCTVARIGGRWVAHPLRGEAAFADELVPADGLGRPAPDSPEPGGAADTPPAVWGSPHRLGPTVRSAPGRWRVRLLDRPEALAQTAVIAGCAPELSLWARAAEETHPGLRVRRVQANSIAALDLLRQGHVHAAGVHLVDPETGEENAPFVRRLLRGAGAVLIHLGVWEEGLAVAPGNPRGIRGVADLTRPGVAIVNREPGAGARLLLEQALAAAGVQPAQVAGFEREVPGHLEVARAVARGRADAGVTTAAVARAFGLGFVPLRTVRYDIAVRREYLDEPPVQALLAALGHRWVRAQLAALGGFDTTRTGEVVAEVAG